jgi:tetratricopeptide (TPR) repeat protein
MCASKNDKGIEYYRAELYDAAKLFFSNQTNLSQEEQAENYFYLGQTYAAMEQLDSAAYFYNKAVTVDPEYPYGYIGQGMLELRNNHKEKANDLFKKATGLVKKNPAVHTAIAEAYINAKQYDKAEEALDRARKMQKNFSGIYVAEGDMLMDQGDTGGACGKYDNAILFDKNDKVAYLKEARVYKSINTDLALEMLNRLVEIDPEYIPAYAELGEIYYRDGYYTKAIDAYEKIMAIPGVPISQESKYAQLLFFVDRYSESLDMIARVLEKDPENFVMKRLQAYNNFKLENYALGLEQMEKLINDTPPDNLIALDYTYYGRLLIKEKQPQKALENLLKAYEMDTTKTELLKEIATAYENTGNYAEAVNYTQKSLDANPESTAIDYFYFGRLCWTAAVSLLTPEASKTAEELAADSIQRNDYLETAIKAFDTVIERMPQSYMGYFWKGKVNYIKDFVLYKGEEGLPKPDYEQALAILLESNEGGKRNKEIIEVYDYLGSYYIVKEDSKAAVEYWKKILELDPANAKALKVMEEFKKSGVE